MDFLDALTLRLSEHKLRRKEVLLAQLFTIFHIQVLQLISDVAPTVVAKFTTSFGRVSSLLVEDEAWCIDEHVVLILLQMIKQVGADKVQQQGFAVFQKWTPHKEAQIDDMPIPLRELWLDTLELLFARKSRDIAWNISSLEMVYRSLKTRSDLRTVLLESTMLHDVVSSMAISAESAPLLVIEIFEYLKGSSNAMQELEYEEAARHLSTFEDGECCGRIAVSATGVRNFVSREHARGLAQFPLPERL